MHNLGIELMHFSVGFLESAVQGNENGISLFYRLKMEEKYEFFQGKCYFWSFYDREMTPFFI